MSIDAIIFDFDGTLAELNVNFLAMRQEVEALARAMGYAEPWPPGYPLEQVKKVAAGLGDGFQTWALRLIEERELATAQWGRLLAFTPGLLREAPALGLKLAVITRNCVAAVRPDFPRGGPLLPCLSLPRDVWICPSPISSTLGWLWSAWR